MARRQRSQEDYRREYLQRVEKARREGFTSPSQATRARAKLKAVAAGAITYGPKPKPKTYEATQRRKARAQEAGFSSDYQLRQYLKRNVLGRGKRTSSTADMTPADMSRARDHGFSDVDIAAIHYTIWSDRSVRSRQNRPFESWIRDPLVRTWLVDVLGKYTDAEFDSRYGMAVAA